MDSALAKAYAAVALDAGLGLREGDRLRIVGEPPHRALMNAIAAAAYDRGAALVRVEYDDPALARIRADRSREAFLDEVPSALKAESEALAAGLWCYLRLEGAEDPGALEGADQNRLTRIHRARSAAVETLRGAYMASRIPWCVMPAATDSWARAILGPGMDAGGGAAAGADALWEVLLGILRLDAPDPAAALRGHMDGLAGRARALDAARLREIRFAGPGTDLRVRLAPESRWIGGDDRTPEGRVFMPNIPTEEVFATPDRRGTEGSVALTRPVRIRGALVEGGSLRFEAGLVVDCSARRGEDALRGLLGTDPGSRRLGEVALVDSGNPIGRSGLAFDSSLLDENAACHIALGAGYEAAFEGSLDWSDEEKAARGFNVSEVHEDLMIGSPGIDAIGVDDSGREIPLMRKGAFII
jgi:aminopeptidase